MTLAQVDLDAGPFAVANRRVGESYRGRSTTGDEWDHARSWADKRFAPECGYADDDEDDDDLMDDDDEEDFDDDDFDDLDDDFDEEDDDLDDDFDDEDD